MTTSRRRPRHATPATVTSTSSACSCPRAGRWSSSGIDGAAAKWQTGGRHRRARRGARATTRSGCTTTSTTCPGRRTRRCSSAGPRWPPSASAPRRVRLGQMVGCNSYREPGGAGQDHLAPSTSSAAAGSTGASAPAGTRTSTRATASSSRRPKDRIGMLRETVQIVRSMWTEAETTFDGKYYKLIAGAVRPEAAAVAAPADLDRWRRRAAHAASGGPLRRLQQLRWQARRVGAQARDPEGSLRGRRPRRGRPSARPGRPRCSCAPPRPRSWLPAVEEPVGRAVRELARGQPGGHARAGVREDPDATSTSAAPASSRGAADYPSTETLELFATQVMPNFR